MSNTMKPTRRRWSEVTAIEYVLIASLIAVFVIAAAQTVGMHPAAAF
jgi:Flp pilus assembly pilin Flp